MLSPASAITARSWVGIRKTVLWTIVDSSNGMVPHTITRRRFVTALGVGGFALGGSGVVSARGHNRNFRAHLSGDNEVPPVETNAEGQAIFQLNKAGDELKYMLIVANIDDVVASHIHCAPTGQNGPVGVTLFSGGPSSENGPLAEGAIAAPDNGNGCGWDTLTDVVEAIMSGDTYVNVHTLEHPPGEIRGQIH